MNIFEAACHARDTGHEVVVATLRAVWDVLWKCLRWANSPDKVELELGILDGWTCPTCEAAKQAQAGRPLVPVVPEPTLAPLGERIKAVCCPRCGRDVHYLYGGETNAAVSCKCVWSGPLSQCKPKPTMRVEEWEVTSKLRLTRGHVFEDGNRKFLGTSLAWAEGDPRWQRYYIYKLPNGQRQVSTHSGLAWQDDAVYGQDPTALDGSGSTCRLILPVAVPMEVGGKE